MGLNFVFARNGKVEHKNPFLAVLAPTWLGRAYPHFAEVRRALGRKDTLLLSRSPSLSS